MRMKRSAVLPADTPDALLGTHAELAAFLATTLNQTRRGELDPRVCNALTYGASVQLRVIENGDLAKRLEAVEAALRNLEAANAGRRSV